MNNNTLTTTPLAALLAAYDADTELRQTMDRGRLAAVLERLLARVEIHIAEPAAKPDSDAEPIPSASTPT